MPDSRLTLSTLLSLKKRRERRIRREIARLEREKTAIEQGIQRLLQTRQQLREQWRQCSSHEQVLSPQQWKSLRAQLSGFYQQDHHLLAQEEAANDEVSRLQREQEIQQQLLCQALLDQEKLRILME